MLQKILQVERKVRSNTKSHENIKFFSKGKYVGKHNNLYLKLDPYNMTKMISQTTSLD